MIFNIDFSRFKIVDLSTNVIPNHPEPEGRPFVIEQGRLADNTIMHNIVNTHTHVGTHIEFPWHYYEVGKSVTDYTLDKFMGPAAMLRGQLNEGEERVTVETCRKQLESKRGKFEILFVRRDENKNPLYFDLDCVDYFADLGIKLFFFDKNIEFGKGPEAGKHFHEAFLSKDIPIGELPENTQDLDRDDFYLFAAPLKIQGLEAAPCRLFAIVER